MSISTWYEKNKQSIDGLMFSIREARLSNKLEGLFDLKNCEHCIMMLISDNTKLAKEAEELQKKLDSIYSQSELNFSQTGKS